MVAMAAAFAVEFSDGMAPNEILAWGDFFGAVAANLIAIADREMYISDPTADCVRAENKKPDTPQKT